MMSWDYRVVRKRSEDGDETYGIHECFFDEEDRVWACAVGPEEALAESPEELRDILVMMLWATTTLNPVVDFDLIPEPGAIAPIAEQLEQIGEGTLETISWEEVRDRWLSDRDGSVTCGTCYHWRGKVSGTCLGRPVAVRDAEFEHRLRYARTDATDWCSRWDDNKDG